MHFPKIFTSKYLVLFFLSLLLSGKLIAQTTITSNVTIDQNWITNNSTGPWTISGTVTVTFGENLTITNTTQYFIISGSNVTIDGAGKTATISGVTNYPGLVKASVSNASSAIIKNIGIATEANSTLISYGGWISQTHNKANISNCYTTGSISLNSGGGIAGANNSGNISKCYSTGLISGVQAGGIAGEFNSGNISNCYTSGNISGAGAGGIAAYYNGGTISNCYTSGNISGQYTGGIAGSEGSGAILNCYTSGSISGQESGGIAGFYYNGSISNCRSSGTLTTGISADIILGVPSTGTISNSINVTPATPNTWDNTIADIALTGLGTIWDQSNTPYTLLPPPLINITLVTAPLTSCSGSSSTPTTFVVIGSGLTASVTITVPSDFEISTSSDGFYSTSLTLTNTSTVSQTLYVRLSSSASVGSKTATITATSTGATDATTSVSGTVNALPSIIIGKAELSGITDNDGIICNGASATLTASGTTATYLWSTSATNTSITISPSTNTTYTVTGTASGCSNTASITITVNAIPAINITESDASGSSNNDSKVCIGGLATLTAIGGSAYSWSTSDLTSSIIPSISSITTYSVTGTTAGCSNTASITITVESLPTLSVGSISLFNEATYLITKTTAVSNNDSWSVSGTITVNNGYVTAGSTPGTYIVIYTDGCAQTVSASVTVAATSSLPAITDGLASYKFNNNPQGPLGSGNVIYMGYNGFNYSSTIRPTNTGFYRANNVSGSSAGSPTEFYIFRCTTCGTVSEYATRPQGTLSGNENSMGQLTYTSSNGGGPFTIIYQATGGSPVTVNNISSTVAFNVVTPTTTTSYKLISVTDEITKATTDFSGKIATVTVPVTIYTIGQAALGGKIAYILQPGDPGYDANVQHGLVAATSDQSTGIQWYNGSYTTTGATGTAIGTGLSNTNTIITSQGATSTSYAAGLARAHTGGGYTDWYLPSKDELDKLYINRVAIGGFARVVYWTSTESGNNNAWVQDFWDGVQGASRKDFAGYVRAIRAF